MHDMSVRLLLMSHIDSRLRDRGMSEGRRLPHGFGDRCRNRRHWRLQHATHVGRMDVVACSFNSEGPRLDSETPAVRHWQMRVAGPMLFHVSMRGLNSYGGDGTTSCQQQQQQQLDINARQTTAAAGKMLPLAFVVKSNVVVKLRSQKPVVFLSRKTRVSVNVPKYGRRSASEEVKVFRTQIETLISNKISLLCRFNAIFLYELRRQYICETNLSMIHKLYGQYKFNEIYLNIIQVHDCNHAFNIQIQRFYLRAIFRKSKSITRERHFFLKPCSEMTFIGWQRVHDTPIT